MRPRITLTVLACAIACLMVPASASAADSCANAAYRTGPGAGLPDCRAWEQVTPADKGGNEPDPVQGILTSGDGDRVLFFSPGAIAPTDGVVFQSAFSSVRGSAWSTFGIDPPIDSFFGTAGLTKATAGFSEDRSKALVVSLRKLTPDAVEGATNLYVRDTTDRSVTLAASVPGTALYRQFLNPDGGFYSASADFEHIAFVSPLALVPGALDDGQSNLYLISGGRVSLASRDAGGDVIASQPSLYPSSGQRLVSDDGRRVTFVRAVDPFGGGDPALYQRVDGASTVLISHSRRANDDPSVPRAVGSNSAWPSADGTQITFQSGDLTDDGPGPFYRWTAGAGDGTLVNLLAGVSPPWSANAFDFNILDVSPEGRYVWFTLTDVDGSGNTIRRLSVLDTSARQVTTKATFEGANGNVANFGSGTSEFSADGTKMVGLTPANLTGYDQTGPNCAGSCDEAFAFDAEDAGAAPVCVSCGDAGTHSLGSARIARSRENYPKATSVTNDGRVFFDTPQPLAGTDANALSDVYEYAPGTPRALISSGTGGDSALVAGVTPSGSDAFFATADRLVAQDDDAERDIYDARVDGGLAYQHVARATAGPCPSGSCPGAEPVVPSANTPGTSLFRGLAETPAFSVGRVSRSARRAAAATGRLRVAVRVGAAGRVSARATVRSSTVGRASSTVRKAGRMTLTVTLSRAARRELARGRTLSVELSVSYSRAPKVARQSFTLAPARPHAAGRGGAR